MCPAVKKADKEDKAKLLDKVDAFIFDCDGKVVFQSVCSPFLESLRHLPQQCLNESCMLKHVMLQV